MPRTTQADVEAIIEVDTGFLSGDLEPFIVSANELVTELCTDSGYSDVRLELIERWLSAHFWQIADQAIDVEQANMVRQQFQFKVDLGLDQTKYGQQAMRLDTKLNLAALNNKAKAEGAKPIIAKKKIGVTYLGNTPP